MLTMLVVAAGLVAAGEGAAVDNDDLSRAPWTLYAEPARGGTVDVVGALGPVYAPSLATSVLPVPILPFPALNIRWGITDNVQLAFPCLVTGSIAVDDAGGVAGLDPRLSLTAGVTGVGFSNITGFLATTSAGAGVALSGKRMALFAAVEAHGLIDTKTPFQLGALGSTGLAVKLDDRWSLGFSASAERSPSLDGSGPVTRVTAGQLYPGNTPSIPTVRFRYDHAWSLELWAFAVWSVAKPPAAVPATGLEELGALASVTWHIAY